MSRVAVVTDTCAGVLPELVEELDIKVVSYYVHREGRMLKDTEIDYAEFFHYLATTHVLPTTANPGAGEYLETFEQAVEAGADGVAVVTMTAEGSGAYQAAVMAQRLFNEQHPDIPVGVCDTRNVSGVHFLFSVEGARAARAGADVTQVMALWQRMIPTTHLLHTAPSLDYLYKGGTNRAGQTSGRHVAQDQAHHHHEGRRHRAGSSGAHPRHGQSLPEDDRTHPRRRRRCAGQDLLRPHDGPGPGRAGLAAGERAGERRRDVRLAHVACVGRPQRPGHG